MFYSSMYAVWTVSMNQLMRVCWHTNTNK